MEYVVFPPARNGVLKNDYNDEIVFADKHSKPFKNFGVWNIKHRGLDKHGRPYAIAEPIMEIKEYGLSSVCFEASSTHWSISVSKSRLENAFKNFTCTDLVSLVNLCNRFGQAEVCRAATTPMNCDKVDFYVSNLFCGFQCEPNKSVEIHYLNGEVGYAEASWVYRNKERLVNTEICVFGGDKLDSIRLLFNSVA